MIYSLHTLQFHDIGSQHTVLWPIQSLPATLDSKYRVFHPCLSFMLSGTFSSWCKIIHTQKKKVLSCTFPPSCWSGTFNGSFFFFFFAYIFYLCAFKAYTQKINDPFMYLESFLKVNKIHISRLKKYCTLKIQKIFP